MTYTVGGCLLFVSPSHTDRCGINADNWASVITMDFLKCIFIEYCVLVIVVGVNLNKCELPVLKS